MKTSDIHNTVRDFFTRHNTASVTVALSGGCDSVSLLSACVRVLGADNVSAVHVNHGIRGDEAKRDEDFCIGLCKDMGVQIKVYTFDIPHLAKVEGTGIEQCAREHRYEALCDGMEYFGSQALVTAHNANDNAESVIFNLCRGSGLSGASGIPEARYEKGKSVLRPLLSFTRLQLEEYAAAEALAYVTDSTNRDTDYTRNYIRANIIPHLTRINSGAISNMTSCCKIISDADDFISKCADDFISSQKKLGSVHYTNISDFSSLHSAVKSAVLGSIYTRICTESLSGGLIDIALDFIATSEPGTKIDLPCRVVLYNCGDEFSISPSYSRDDYSVELKEGVNDLSPWGFNITVVCDPDENFVQHYKNIYNFVKCTILNTDIIRDSLTARSRAENDTYTVNGMSRKSKKLLSDKKIPHDRRPTYPMICDGTQAVCLPGCPASDGYDGRNSVHKTYIIYTYSE